MTGIPDLDHLDHTKMMKPEDIAQAALLPFRVSPFCCGRSPVVMQSINQSTSLHRLAVQIDGRNTVVCVCLCAAADSCLLFRTGQPLLRSRGGLLERGPSGREVQRGVSDLPRRAGGRHGSVRLGALLSRVNGKWSRAVTSAVRTRSGSLSGSHIRRPCITVGFRLTATSRIRILLGVCE